MKKDLSTKSKKREQDSKFESEKILEETKANRDKIQKLAVQFDKELADRDKQINGMRQSLLSEVQKLASHVQADLEALRKAAAEIEIKKTDKRETLELKQVLVQGLERKPEMQELQNHLNSFLSEHSQKVFDLK
jgi:hypothetical protein